jgi:6,7-dimethyl-8-ribityllumazine synthase
MYSFQHLKLGIVVAQFNERVTSDLKGGAERLLQKHGLKPTLVWEVPGAFELPLACQWGFENRDLDAIIALGAVIRGGTPHFDYVCSGVTSGIMQIQLKFSKPVGFGLLTCDTMEQAMDRSGGKMGNKGAETASAVLELLQLKNQA